MTPLFSGEVFSANGRSTWAADSIVTEVVTMKMINSTKKISVSGVILMSAKTPPPPVVPLTATALSPLQRGVDQAIAVDLQKRIDVLNLDREVVEENNRDDCDCESERGGDQRGRDTGGDDRESAGAHDRHRLEGNQDADHGAEQSDERCGSSCRRENPYVAVQLEGLLEASLFVELDQVIAIQRLRGGDQHVIDALRRVAARLGRLQSFVELALAKRSDQRIGELGRFGLDAGERPQAFENDRQDYHRDEQQGIRRVVTFLDHRENTELTAHCYPFTCSEI